MKRVIAAIMILVMALSMSGCKISYWDGLSKSEAREFVEKTLEEKYGEEFLVAWISTRTGYNYTELVGACSPKSNLDIIFDFEANNFGERHVHDGYIQSVVRQEIKENIDSVLLKYYDIFASEVYVRGLSDLYKSEIYDSKEATIKNYTEALPDSNSTGIWIALNEVEIDNQDKVAKVTDEMTESFHLTNAGIYFYYVTDDIIKQCKEEIDNPSHRTGRLGVYAILNGKFPNDTFVYNGSDKDNKLVQVEFANKQTAFNGG